MTRASDVEGDELKKTFSREELHELVWSIPVERLAKQYGFSDRGFAKICERHLVPVPPRGYWAKLNAGQAVKPTALRAVQSPALQTVNLASKGPKGQSDYLAEVLAEAKAARIIQRGAEEETQHETHLAEDQRLPVAAETAMTKSRREFAPFLTEIRKVKPDRNGFSYYKFVKVPPDAIPRVVALLSMLLSELEMYGFTLHEDKTWLGFGKDGCALSIHIDAPRKLIKSPTRSGWNMHEHEHVGRLEVSINGRAEGIRKKWIDTETRKVEDATGEIVESFLVNHVVEREREAQSQAEEGRRAAMALRRRMAEQRTARECKRVAFFQEVADARREIFDLRATIGLATPAGVLPEDYRRMLDWARMRLSALEVKTTAEAIQAALAEQNLFPDPDDLFDPLGDPPPKQNFWDD